MVRLLEYIGALNFSIRGPETGNQICERVLKDLEGNHSVDHPYVVGIFALMMGEQNFLAGRTAWKDAERLLQRGVRILTSSENPVDSVDNLMNAYSILSALAIANDDTDLSEQHLRTLRTRLEASQGKIAPPMASSPYVRVASARIRESSFDRHTVYNYFIEVEPTPRPEGVSHKSSEYVVEIHMQNPSAPKEPFVIEHSVSSTAEKPVVYESPKFRSAPLGGPAIAYLRVQIIVWSDKSKSTPLISQIQFVRLFSGFMTASATGSGSGGQKSVAITDADTLE